MTPRGRSDRPVGRRPGDPQDTRSDILAAARDLFSELGYERATIRGIAGRAAVDPALVIHYFRNKEALFVAAHELSFDPAAVLAQAADLPTAERGRAVAKIYLDVAASPDSAALSMVRAAATNERAAAMVNQFITAVFLDNAEELIPGPDGPRRLALVGSHLLGVVVARSIVGLAPLTTATIDELADLIGPAIQTYFDPPSRAPVP